jgi:hypothetical protein
MNTPAADLITLFILAVACFGSYVCFHFGTYRRHQLKAERYRLFAVRDQIVRLVVDEKISEEDGVFEFLYRRVNEILPAAKPLTLRGFVRVIKSTDFSRTAKAHSMFMKDLETKDPDVQRAAYALIDTTKRILIERAVLLKSALRVGIFGITCGRGILRVFSRFFSTEREAYRLYRDMEATAKEIESFSRLEPAYA